MGDIGSNFARRAHALGAEVVGVRRTVHPDTPCPDYCTRVVAQSALDAELPQADLVALSLPGTPETLHLFGAERLALCTPGASLLNVGRGTAVDGEALAAAVHSGQLSAPRYRRLQPAQDAGQYRGYFCTQPQALCRRSAAG